MRLSPTSLRPKRTSTRPSLGTASCENTNPADRRRARIRTRFATALADFFDALDEPPLASFSSKGSPDGRVLAAPGGASAAAAVARASGGSSSDSSSGKLKT